MPAVLIDGLIKSFGSVRALDGLGLTVRTGEVHGFLGPIGAGRPPRYASCSACNSPPSSTGSAAKAC
ncbi:hypothetical protein ACFWYW_57220 [Nonomuraea sp. NPDC059023]|uniref:hypothetical protein n=1 Tax=unclassified Nonomuraea TaxID=2593643 RepID=UPI0036BE2D61